MLWIFGALVALFAAALVFTFFAIKVMLAFWFVTLVVLPFWLGMVFSALVHPLAGLAVGGVVFWGSWQVNRWLLSVGTRRNEGNRESGA